MKFSQLALVWVIAFITAIYLTQGTNFQTFTILIFLVPTVEMSLHISGIKEVYGLEISLALLIYIVGITYYSGFRHSATDPFYLPFTASLLCIYAYSWLRVKKGRKASSSSL